jgi:CRP-like cAMP-binding protein
MVTPATDALLKRLRATAALDADDASAIEKLPIVTQRLEGGVRVVGVGDRPDACCLLINGFIVRSKANCNGSRQILSLHQSGDIPDLQSLYLHVMDHDVTTLNECLVGFIKHDTLRQLVRNRPNVAEILWRDTLVDAAIFREWILNLGGRGGPGRIAHLMLEIHTRLKLIGRVADGTFSLPMTQQQLGEAIGMTSVHVNRVLRALKRDELLDFSYGVVKILNETKLRELAGFDPLYLHLKPDL